MTEKLQIEEERQMSHRGAYCINMREFDKQTRLETREYMKKHETLEGN